MYDVSLGILKYSRDALSQIERHFNYDIIVDILVIS